MEVEDRAISLKRVLVEVKWVRNGTLNAEPLDLD